MRNKCLFALGLVFAMSLTSIVAFAFSFTGEPDVKNNQQRIVVVNPATESEETTSEQTVSAETEDTTATLALLGEKRKVLRQMTVTKNTKGLWDVQFYYKDYRGINMKKHKRNFRTKKEATEWAERFIVQQSHNLDMDFEAFWQIYRADMGQRLRENTLRSKDYIVELKILPYFGKRKITEIKAADVRLWQNELMKKGYSQTYLRSVNNQLAAIFNYATKYYDLPKNPCNQAGTIGKGKAEEMKFWTQEEFERFLDCVKDKSVSYYGFLTLYWTGCRIGELLALTLEDFNAEEKTLRINKSYQRINGRDVITPPKTEKGKRIITLPDYLAASLCLWKGISS